MVKIRLKRMGSKYNAFYRIVAADERSPRDGKYIEDIGYYNPHSKEVRVDFEIKDKWISQGAAPSTTVKNLLTKIEKLGLKSNEVGYLPKMEKKVKKVAPKVEVKDEAPVEEAKPSVAKTEPKEEVKDEAPVEEAKPSVAKTKPKEIKIEAAEEVKIETAKEAEVAPEKTVEK